MRQLLVCVAILSLCGTAFAASKGDGARAATPLAVDVKTDPVLSRLALTEDEVKAIDKLNQDAEAKKAELMKADPKPKGKEMADKIKAIKDELLKGIRAALTADQQTKFDAGQALVDDYRTKCKEAAGDKDKLAALKADLDKALDEKVGKVGAAPAAKAPANP